MLGSSGNERRVAFAALERTMQSEGVSWSDIGNFIADGKYTEEELQEYGQALRAEGVEAGIQIGLTRASQHGSNGHLTLPNPREMAEYCHSRLSRLKDDKQREFVNEVRFYAQRGAKLTPGRLGYLASIYIQQGGRT
jgi:hypothetical protein